MSKIELSEKSKDELVKIIEGLNAKNSKLSDSVSQMKVRLAALGQSETDDEPARKRKKTGKPEKVFEKLVRVRKPWFCRIRHTKLREDRPS